MSRGAAADENDTAVAAGRRMHSSLRSWDVDSLKRSSKQQKVLWIILGTIFVQGCMWILPFSASSTMWAVPPPVLQDLPLPRRVETFAEMQQSAWCQPSYMQSLNSLHYSNGKNSCSSFDAQYFELSRQAEIDAGIQRIYYINLEKNKERRKNMEKALRNQTALSWTGPPIPFKRISAVSGQEPPSVCAPSLQHPERCQGVQGILKSNLRIMQYENVKVRERVMGPHDAIEVLSILLIYLRDVSACHRESPLSWKMIFCFIIYRW